MHPQLGVEPVAYTKAIRVAALPWNQRRERRDAASTSELDRPVACLNSRPKPAGPWMSATDLTGKFVSVGRERRVPSAMPRFLVFERYS
jgi:hypothetical protein